MNEPRLDTPPTRARALGIALFGLVFVAAGAIVEWLSFVRPPSDPAWLVRIAGLIFIVPGIWIALGALRSLLGVRSDPEAARIYKGVMMASLLWLFALSFGGVALFGEASSMSGGITGSSTEVRIWFGLFGIAIGLFALMFSIVVLGAILARMQKNRPPEAK